MEIPFHSKAEVMSWAATYRFGRDNGRRERLLMREMPARANAGYLQKRHLIAAAKWKWRGGKTWQDCDRNRPMYVREATALAFSTTSEFTRIGVLLALSGVGYPMASVLLHFALRTYPILDRFAMAAVDGDTHYTYEEWIEYVSLTRAAAGRFRVSMRELDRALWKYGRAMVG